MQTATNDTPNSPRNSLLNAGCFRFGEVPCSGFYMLGQEISQKGLAGFDVGLAGFDGLKQHIKTPYPRTLLKSRYKSAHAANEHGNANHSHNTLRWFRA